MKPKYITFDIDGIPSAVVFPCYVEHSTMARKLEFPVLGAGFVHVGEGGKAQPEGHSHSLQVKPSKDCQWALEQLYKSNS
jgi:hypothetical protein